MRELENHLVVISGASSGLGYEFAKAFHELGAKVWLIARRSERLQEMAVELNTRRADSCRCTVADLTKPEDLDALVSELQRETVHIFVSNAGRGSFGNYADLPVEGEKQIVALNVAAPISLLSAVLPNMKKAGSGMVVVVSSVVGFQPMPSMATYAASKAFNLYHGLALRQELKPYGIKVVNLCPGPTTTEFFGAARASELVGRYPRDDAGEVVRHCIRAMARNQGIILPSWRAWGIAWAFRLMPYWLSTWLAATVTRPATKGD